MAYQYHARVLEELARHGLVPRPDTPPDQLRDVVRDLYKYEIRRLRLELLAGRIRKPDYAAHVIALRGRYPLLSLPVQLWIERPDRGRDPEERPPPEDDGAPHRHGDHDGHEAEVLSWRERTSSEAGTRMQDFEKLGLFYLGRRVDPDTGTVTAEPLLYDSRDLVTHAVCVGMTGSGKTGLCLGLMEEAAIDGVPVLAIDPKGDLTNLLLTFPGLTPAEFAPWIDPDEARRAGRTPEAFAEDEARRWREGLEAWGQDGARIERLRRSAEFTVYTPGSTAGAPVSIAGSLAAPPPGPAGSREDTAERAATAASSVLALAGVEAAPRSREHTLLTTILSAAWAAGRDLDLARLIHELQSPPVDKVGVVDLESFYPAKERFELAMRLNALLAAPGFDLWLQGAPLDPASLLYTADGRPRVAIFSIAHLGDGERMFFVSLLLNQVVAWMRRQTGTSSLRALVYMDEIMGYFPPVATPPSKAPLLTLLKQARAFGVGVVLATQNPVDLDYKGLGNAGTWFLGRLQTERDKARVLDGLESAAAGGIERAEADRLLSGLQKRVFLLHNVHQPRPVLFQTRWAMSYLRGPMSIEQIRQARQLHGAAAAQPSLRPAPGVAAPLPASPYPATAGDAGAARAAGARPVVPPEVAQVFVPPRSSRAPVRYTAAVLGAAQVGFSDTKLGVALQRDVVYAAPIADTAVPVDWPAARALDVLASALTRAPEPEARFEDPPPAALQPRNYAAWEKAFARHLAQNERLELLVDRELKLTSRPGESERDFRIRVHDAAREARDAAVEAVRKKFAAKRDQLEKQGRRAEAAVERETQQASQAKLQTGVSMAATVLGALFGRKTVSTGSLGRATTAARGVGRSMKEADDIRRATADLEEVRRRTTELERVVADEIEAVAARYAAERPLDLIALAPRRGQVTVQFVALGWIPEDVAS